MESGADRTAALIASIFNIYGQDAGLFKQVIYGINTLPDDESRILRNGCACVISQRRCSVDIGIHGEFDTEHDEIRHRGEDGEEDNGGNGVTVADGETFQSNRAQSNHSTTATSPEPTSNLSGTNSPSNSSQGKRKGIHDGRDDDEKGGEKRFKKPSPTSKGQKKLKAIICLYCFVSFNTPPSCGPMSKLTVWYEYM